MPSPKSRNGVAVSPPVADAFGVVNNPPSRPGPDVVVLAAGFVVPLDPPNSRRLNASAVHAKGAAAGTPSPLLPANHASNPRFIPDTDPFGTAEAAGAVAVIAGVATATAGAATLVTVCPADHAAESLRLPSGAAAAGATLGATSPAMSLNAVGGSNSAAMLFGATALAAGSLSAAGAAVGLPSDPRSTPRSTGTEPRTDDSSKTGESSAGDEETPRRGDVDGVFLAPVAMPESARGARLAREGLSCEEFADGAGSAEPLAPLEPVLSA